MMYPHPLLELQQRPPRVSKEQRDQYFALLDKYYMSGTWYGQSAAGIVYILATALERVDNDLLWYVPHVSSGPLRYLPTKARNSWPYEPVHPMSNITFRVREISFHLLR